MSDSQSILLNNPPPGQSPVVEGLLLSLSSLRATSVVLMQQLHTATETFGGVNMCMLNTDLNPVCGTSEPRALVEQRGGEQGRFLMDTVRLKLSSRPVAHWGKVSCRDVLTTCVFCVCGWVFICPVVKTYTEGWVTAAIPASNTYSGFWVYHQTWCFISTVVLCHGSETQQWYGRWEGPKPCFNFTSHDRLMPYGDLTFYMGVLYYFVLH